MSEHDEQWANWCRDFDAAHQDITRLFHNRYVWLAIRDMIGRTGHEIGFNTIVQNWLTTNYAHTLCTGIRRETDRNPKTSSLNRCVAQLRENPAMATRERYAAALPDRPDMPRHYREQFVNRYDEFVAAPGADHLDITKIETHLAELKAAAETTRAYTNKIIAHREVVTDKPITLRWDELDKALNKVGEVLKHYYKLRHPGSILGNLTPELPLGWEKPFRSAWCPEDYWPTSRPAKTADTYVHQVDNEDA